ncbi:hypothetical protein HZY97_16230 [Sphingomonas sp. R-74633]|uniref:hypothetical protein n=1 Tax=Sphingomonas sp. R-74633 TaxID=2751188 RepID=UPI0015D35F63|nr:hypothetical protein [Sphingomonas sp. R-74633]NYT42321.1 hypothetical protein [Sphingomonas sp. R-74633]
MTLVPVAATAAHLVVLATGNPGEVPVPIGADGALPVRTAGGAAIAVEPESAPWQLGADGGADGDWLGALLIVPLTTSPGLVSISDGGGDAIPIFAGGANSVGNLLPVHVPLGMTSAAGGWEVTTGANVNIVAIGNFT